MTEKFLEQLVNTAKETIASGYYEIKGPAMENAPSLKTALGKEGVKIIAEVKRSSPSEGDINHSDVDGIIERYVKDGACALSVLAEPEFFKGSLENLSKAARTGLPVLMKDIIIDPVQIKAGKHYGASAVLIILRIFEDGLSDHTLFDLINVAHENGLEVLLEVNSMGEWQRSTLLDADIIGINNRDLDTLEVDIGTTGRILYKARKTVPIVSMSGVKSKEDALKLLSDGADAILAGTALMKDKNLLPSITGGN